MDIDRFGRHRRNYYSQNGMPSPSGPTSRGVRSSSNRPLLPEMVSIAEKLGEDTDFVRVDLYALRDRIVFGELTNYPRTGSHRFTPESFDYELGAWSALPGDAAGE